VHVRVELLLANVWVNENRTTQYSGAHASVSPGGR
jgi:hypothetical protein